MRAKICVVVLVLCVSLCAFGDTIGSVTPSTIPFGNVEEFLTVRGTGLIGTESTLVVFDGTTSIEPNNVDPAGLEVIVWIPAAILFVEGQHSLEVVATDVGGAIRRIGPGTFTIASNPGGGDDGPPYIQVPEIVIGEATSSSGGPAEYSVVGTSRNGDPAPVVCSPESGSLFLFGLTLVSCTATDAFGSTSGTFSVIITDTTPPAITVPADFSSAGPVVTFTASAVDAIDGIVGVSCTPASGSTFTSGTTTVQCLAYDSRFNATYGFFDVTVTEGAPTIAVPDDISVPATSAAGAVVTFAASATGGATIACTPASGSTFTIGTTTVTCTATNASGSASGSFSVTVVDEGPELTVPADMTVEATSPAGATVTFTVSATDAVDGTITATCAPSSGDMFPLGTTTVSCSATDSAGNVATEAFDVTVVDTTAPQFVLLEASPGVLWPPNHKMVDITLTAVVWDAVDGAPVTQIVSVASDQPVNGTGDGDTAPDWVVTGPLTLQLRAERAGNDDRTYTIRVQAVDEAGNVGEKAVTVKVSQGRRRR